MKAVGNFVNGRRAFFNMVRVFEAAGHSPQQARRYAALAFYHRYNATPATYDRAVMQFKETFDILGVFDKRPVDALKYFQSKKLLTEVNFAKLSAEAQAKAFAISGVMKIDLLQDVKTWLTQALDEGTSYKEFRETLLDRMRQRGWLSKGDEGEKVASRLKTIYRTNKQSALMAGRYKQQQQARAVRPYLQYIAVLDPRTTDICKKLSKFVAPADDPVWDKITPPNHFGCRARTRSLSERDLKRLGLQVSDNPSAVLPDLDLQQGFDTNPAKEFWLPDPSVYDAELQAQVQQIKEQAAEMQQAAESLPATVTPPTPKKGKKTPPSKPKHTPQMPAPASPAPIQPPAPAAPAPTAPTPAAPQQPDDGFTKEISQPYTDKDLKLAAKKYLSYRNDVLDTEDMRQRDPRLSREEEFAVRFYTTGNYDQLNKALRAKKLKGEQAAMTRIINTALSKLPKHTKPVKRGVNLGTDDLEKFLEQHQPGGEVQYTAFTSTSSGESFGGNVIMHITPKTGVSISHMSMAPDEEEVLLPAGARFRVLSVKKFADPKGGRTVTHIYMEEI